MKIIKIITNVLISTSMMIIFTYFFYFYVIVQIEQNDFYELLNNEVVKDILNIKFNNSYEINMNIKKNNLLHQKAINLVVYIAMPAIFISIILIILFKLNVKNIIITNSIILFTTIIAEIIFAFVFTKKFTIMDNSTFKIMILDAINSYVYNYTHQYGGLCNQQII